MSAPEKVKDAVRPVATNPQAGHLYYLLDRYEAGLVLLGTEVKAAREGKINLKEAYVNIQGDEAWLLNCHIGAYSKTGYASHEPTRARKLLLHKEQIRKLSGKLTLRGYTLVPTKVYAKAGRLKLEVAVAEGKKLHDKREALRQKDAKREVQRTLKERR